MRYLSRIVTLAIPLIVAFGLQLPAVAAEPPRISNNPFSRPPSSAPASTDPARISSRSPQWAPELRATMVGSRARFANVTGTILAVGESAGGYRLVAVEENKAVLLKDGEQHVLYVRPDTVGDANE